MEKAKELSCKEELGKTGKIQGEKPVDTIRRMNPGQFIPAGKNWLNCFARREK